MSTLSDARAGASTKVPHLLFFRSKTSGPCRKAESMVAHTLQRSRNHESFALHPVDVDERPDLASRFAVNVVPTLLILVDGRVRGRLENVRKGSDIRTLLEPWLQSPRH